MASNYQFTEPGAGFPGVSQTATTPLVRPGLIAGAVDPTYGYAEFMYVAGASASAPTAGDFCVIGAATAQQIVSGNTSIRGPVGIAPAAISGTNVYGWAQVYGVCDYANLGTQATGAAGANLFIGTTAGRAQVTNGTAAGYYIDGAQVSQYSTTANSNSGIVNLYYPIFNGR